MAILVFDLAERSTLSDDVRNRLAARAVPLKLETIVPCFGSLARDPLHRSTYYMAVEVVGGPAQLLHMALASAPTSSIFPKPLLVGRMRRPGGPEIVINTIPFGCDSLENLERYVSRVDGAFVPRPQGARMAIVAAPVDRATSVKAAFKAFRTLFKRTGKNLAAIETSADLYDIDIWEAIRAGWRDGYSAGIEIRAAEDLDREAIRRCARFSRFRINLSDVVGAADAAVEERFEALFPAEERAWILGEFVRTFEAGDGVCDFAAAEAMALAVRFGPALKLCERVHEWIREARSASKAGKGFDFEVALPAAGVPEALFCLHWLKAGDHAAQFIDAGPMASPDFESGLRTFAALCRQYGCLPTLDGGAGHSDRELETIARATGGRLNYRVSAGPEDPAEYAERLTEIALSLLG